MAYSIEEQLTLDINWYFIDHFNRLCVATSAGGLLPVIIAENEENNMKFHDIVLELPEKYEAGRNVKIIEYLEGVNVDNVEYYFRSFEILARKGLYVFDRCKPSINYNSEYYLVAYPVKYIDGVYPVEKDVLSLIPKTKGTFHKRQKTPKDLNILLSKTR